jgi:hypothetical protein
VTPSLLVQAPDRYRSERAWVLEVLLTRWLGVSFALRFDAREDTRICRPDAEAAPGLRLPERVFATPVSRWRTADPLPARVAWAAGMPALALDGPLPLLLQEVAEGEALVGEEGADFQLRCDVPGTAFLYLSRYEESLDGPRDRHGRFRSAASFAARLGLTEVPVVDLQVQALAACLERLWPGLTRPPAVAPVHVSHDVDLPFGGWGRPARRALSRAAGDIVHRGSPLAAMRTLIAWAAGERHGTAVDPCNSFAFLMDVSEALGLRSAFYFSAPEAEVQPFDSTYDLRGTAMRRILEMVASRGHEVGVHPSYATPGRPDLLAPEVHRVREAARRAGLQQDRWGGRQHYLRWDPARTWGDWEDAGLDYDSSLGWANAVGFRCGTCRSYPVFDLTERRAQRLEERPLVAMDVALTGHRQLSEGLPVRLGELARTCRRVGGTFTLLWHNDGLATAKARARYARVLSAACSPG